MNTKILNEVHKAYADVTMDWEKGKNIRNLNFRASMPVSRDDAYEIMKKCVPSYNEFEPELILKFPADAFFVIAREGSVCLYVLCTNPPSEEAVLADEKSKDGYLWRYWWD